MICSHMRMCAGVNAHRLCVANRVDIRTVSANIILSDEANQEVRDYLHSASSIVSVNRMLISGGGTDLTTLAMHCMTVMDPVD